MNSERPSLKDLILKDHILGIITAVLFAIGLAAVAWVLMRNWSSSRNFEKMGNVECVRKHHNRTFSDPDMEGAMAMDKTYRVFENYYQCNPISRDDVVLFRYSAHQPPVPRIVRGLPGDTFAMEETEEHKWTIAINGQKVQGPDAHPYIIFSETTPPLKTYQDSRKGVLGPDEYILLSNQPPGHADSGNLGVIKKGQIAARIFPID